MNNPQTIAGERNETGVSIFPGCIGRLGGRGRRSPSEIERWSLPTGAANGTVPRARRAQIMQCPSSDPRHQCAGRRVDCLRACSTGTRKLGFLNIISHGARRSVCSLKQSCKDWSDNRRTMRVIDELWRFDERSLAELGLTRAHLVFDSLMPSKLECFSRRPGVMTDAPQVRQLIERDDTGPR